jgi:glucose/arabinose dehydrogenase
VLDPSDGVDGYQEERGLLGVAFHPDFATNNLLYVHYSARSGETDFPDGQTVIAEYTAGPTGVDVGTERVVLDVTQPATNHNGGSIVFGGDGMLYIALGDGGGGDDQFGNGQDETTLLGAILRINPLAAGGEDYTVPAGNLSETLATAAPELWDYGLRNPFRMNFDGCTGDLYIGDVGQNAKEEIDIERAGEGHHNYGWPIVEGTICGPAGGGGCDGDFTAPATDYDRGDGGAVIGGSVYRGSEIPWLRGTYFFTDQIQEQVWSAVYDRDAGTISTPANMTSSLPVGTPAAIQNGNDGELYFVSLFGGTVYKLVQAP